MKILQSQWYTNKDGTIGIVRVETDYDGIQYFIGHVSGLDEQSDTKYVADWGSRFDYDAGQVLFGV
jgi:hypothetical protein